MAELSIRQSQGAVPRVAGWVRALRAVYLVCAALLTAGVIGQVFFAGAALLVNGRYLEMHRVLAHLIELLAMLTAVAGLLTRLSWRIQTLGLLFLLLMFAQYAFLYAMPALGLPALRALHAVNALVMFWVALRLGQRTWQQLHGGEATRHDR